MFHIHIVTLNVQKQFTTPLSPIYQVYSELGYIDPESVETEQQETDYYNSLLCGNNRDLISENR
ncbi:MAG: hypothetical protein ACRD6U_04860 [Nitrososphaeraceae archaeon]